MDDDEVADVDFRQHAVDGEFVIVLAERARDVVFVVAGRRFLAGDRDVVVGAVHRGAHEVRHAGVEADVVLVGLFLVDGRRDEPAGGAGDGAAALGEDRDVAEAGGNHELIVELVDALADLHEVERLLLGTVGNAEAAAEVHELDVDAEALLELAREREHEFRREEERLRAALVRGDHRVQAEALDALFLRHLVGLEELVAREAVLRLGRLADDVVALHEVAGIVAEAEALRQAGVLLEVVEVADVVEVDDGAELDGFLELIGGRIVRGEQDLLALDTGDVGEHELGEAAAVRARALLVENLQDARVRQRLDGELLAEARCPGKGLLQRADARADFLLVVDVERCGIFFDDLAQLGERQRECFFGHGQVAS